MPHILVVRGRSVDRGTAPMNQLLYVGPRGLACFEDPPRLNIRTNTPEPKRVQVCCEPIEMVLHVTASAVDAGRS
jgi:hypothetical protein